MKTVVVTALKLALVAGLIYWLVAYGKLDFKELAVFLEKPESLLLNALVWGVCYVALGAFRWFVLLRALGLAVSFLRAIHLQMIGFFFNTAIPGAVGGDIVKALYVMREQRASGKTHAMLTVVLDRISGLVGLFILAGLGIAANWEFVSTHEPTRMLAAVTGASLVAIIAGLSVVFFPFAPGKDPFRAMLSKKVPGFSKILGIYEALRVYRDKPLTVLTAVALSLLIQTGSLLFALYMTRLITGAEPGLATFMTVYPLGIITTAVPLAPGGLGVGHFAFEKLFAMVGLTGGANVFNVLVMGQLAMHLLGVIPYLLYRSKLPGAGEIEKELHASSV